MIGSPVATTVPAMPVPIGRVARNSPATFVQISFFSSSTNHSVPRSTCSSLRATVRIDPKSASRSIDELISFDASTSVRRRSALRRSCSNMCDEVVAQSQAVAFEAFQERDYRRFWTTQFISNIGSWMQGIAQGWLVYRMTDSPFLLGFVGFANSIPQFFL